MAYVLLTGVTGLVGRYLVRDLLQTNVRLAVLVRPSRRQTARQRMETLLAEWEEELGHALPRPVVLEGDISEPDLGLDPAALRWISEHCDSIIHNAASLQFVATSKESEPWRSNVQGVQHVLDVCQQAGIRQFHHVSTAYVCGLREGLILESELDVGQTLSNDYEQSKVEAEKLVRSAPFIDSLTVYRPAIITGDSQTGYTTTYHGFYAPVQLSWTFARNYELNETGLRPGRFRFPLAGYETKNLVPVEWVSAVMAHIFTHPEHHGKTYHLTPRHRVQARLLGDVLEQECGFYAVRFQRDGEDAGAITEVEQTFRELIGVYATYWRDDPVFDTTNTVAAAPHLPCPSMDRATLAMMARVAIDTNFAAPRSKPIPVALDVHKLLEGWTDSDDASNRSPADSIHFEVDGPGGGQWTLSTRGGQIVAAELGVDTPADVTVRLDVDTLSGLLRGDVDVEQVVSEGRRDATANATTNGSASVRNNGSVRAADALRLVLDSLRTPVAAGN
jgi:thioester reductase-like protein